LQVIVVTIADCACKDPLIICCPLQQSKSQNISWFLLASHKDTSLEAPVSVDSARVHTRLAAYWEDDEPQANAPVSRVAGGTPCTTLALLPGANKPFGLISPNVPGFQGV